MGATPTEGPTEGIRPDEEPVCYAGTGRQPVWVRVPPLPLMEASRPEQKACLSRTQGAVASPASSTCRGGRGVKTPGPQPGDRGSNPRRGTYGVRRAPVPGSRAGRRPVVTRKAGVRAPPWQHNARWPRKQARGCKPRDEGESPSRASIATHVVVVQRRGCEQATLAMRVRLPPATPLTDKAFSSRTL